LKYQEFAHQRPGKSPELKFEENDYTRAFENLLERMTMADDEIGYGKPPLSGRFRPGVSGNPSGRPKRKPNAAEPRSRHFVK
jgi:hypothetical protein